MQQIFDKYIEECFDLSKQTSRELRDFLIKSFISAMCKSTSIENIESWFRKLGVVPLDQNQPYSSEFDMQQKNQVHDSEAIIELADSYSLEKCL